VERLDLPVDTSVAVGRSIVPALDTNGPQCAIHIDRLKIGDVVVRNVPVRVGWSEPDSSNGTGAEDSTSGIEELRVFTRARLLRPVFDEVRYNYADGSFTMIRDVCEGERHSNFGVTSEQRAHRAGKGSGQPMAGVIDTGNLWGTHLHASSLPPQTTPRRSTRCRAPLRTATSGRWARVPLAFPSGWRRKKMVVREAGGKPYRLQASFGADLWNGFGADLWNGGTLVLDGRNRRAYAKNGDGFAQTRGSWDFESTTPRYRHARSLLPPSGSRTR
jgi:hypothetical protein